MSPVDSLIVCVNLLSFEQSPAATEMSQSSSGEHVEFRRIAGALVQTVRRELVMQNGSGSSGENEPARSNLKFQFIKETLFACHIVL